MNQNVSPWDRFFRVVVGLVLLAMAVAGPQTGWGLLGVVPLITGATGFCPFYRVFGITEYWSPRRQLQVR